MTFPTRSPITHKAADTVWVQARRAGKTTYVALSEEDEGKIKHGQLFVNDAGTVRIKYPAWRSSKLLCDHLFDHRVTHKNGDRLDFRRGNVDKT